MNGVFIIPTGIGCSIGGHSGDAVCAVNLISSVCNNLIVNPNAVNASDINEMATNCLYVEGSIIDRFLHGDFGLRKVRQNKILLAVNTPVHTNTINSVNAGKISLGVDIEICELKTPLILNAKFKNDIAKGEVFGWKELVSQVKGYSFDALAIQTIINVEDSVAEKYLLHGGINPWGGVEALASKLIANQLDKPVAHSPQEKDNSFFSSFCEVVDPRMSAETVSVSYLHCILKGLAKAPRISSLQYSELSYRDIDFLITPDNCFGNPHKICLKKDIPIIVVKDNTTVLNNKFPDRCIMVENYLEAVGWIMCHKIGIKKQSVLSWLVKEGE